MVRITWLPGRQILGLKKTLLLINIQVTNMALGYRHYDYTRSLGALRAPTSSWTPFGSLDFVLRALRALRPCDPRVGDWIVC